MLRHFISTLLLPPFCFVVLAVIGMVFALKNRRLGFRIVVVSIFGIYILSMSYVSQTLLWSLQIDDAYQDPSDKTAQAIVVLGCGSQLSLPEYDGKSVPSGCEMERLTYAVYLSKKTGVPILLSGRGHVSETRDAESVVMKDFLQDYFAMPVSWLETQSKNTAENAFFSKKILSDHGVKSVYLVTHAWHMRRARYLFEKAGFEVVPAPTLLVDLPNFYWDAFIADGDTLRNTYRALREYLGYYYYKVTI